MECFSLGLLAGLLLGGLAAVRDLRGKLRTQGDRLDDLRGHLESLERRLEELRPEGTAEEEAIPPRREPEKAGRPSGEQPPAAAPSPGPLREPPVEAPAAQPVGGSGERSSSRSVEPSGTAPSTATALPPGDGPDGLQIDWEQWLGMRGAAVLGGVALAIAAFFFLRYSIEQGYFPPSVRVTLAFLVGAACLGGSEILRRRDYATTANAVAGAGVVILYAATWAARELYGLLPLPVALGLMVLITVVCGLLAWRHGSQVIALLGLLGGFATPLLLATGQDHPLGLFGYILLLDAGLLVLARRQGWPVLAPLAVLGTLGYQGLWILDRMEAGDLTLALAILGAFGLLFLLIGDRDKDEGLEREEPKPGPWAFTRWSGALLPFVFGLHLASRAELTPHLGSLAVLLVLISAAAAWLARGPRAGSRSEPALAVWVALGDVAVVAAWASVHDLTPERIWSLTAAALALSAAFHLPAVVEAVLPAPWLGKFRHGRDGGPAAGQGEPAPSLLAGGGPAAAVAAGGFLLLFLLLGPFDFPTAALAPWLLAVIALGGLLVWQGRLPAWAWLRPVTAAMLGAGVVLFHLLRLPGVEGARQGGPPPGGLAELALPFGIVVILALALHALALTGRSRRPERSRRPDDLASVLLPAAALVLLLPESMPYLQAAPAPARGGLVLLLALLAVLGATRLPSGLVYLGVMLLVALHHGLLAMSFGANLFDPWTAGPKPPPALLGLSLAAAVAVFTFWPLLAPRLAARRAALWSAALAGPLWLLPLMALWIEAWGGDWIGMLPLALGALSLAGLAGALRTLEAAPRRRALVWLSAAALGLVALAVPVQLDRGWVVVGWSLQVLASVALWRRLDHPGLKWMALGLGALVTGRLVLGPLEGDYLVVVEPLSLGRLAYAYLVPVAALGLAARWLGRREIERLRPWEEQLVSRKLPWAAAGLGAATVLLGFVWGTRTVLEGLGPGRAAWGGAPGLEARDLTLSLAWILYALVLLALGFLRRLTPLRWTGLGVLVLTLGKVFLYDLGELEDLYRVASLVGLAISLLLVSLAYQRFSRGLEEEDRAGEDGRSGGPEA